MKNDKGDDWMIRMTGLCAIEAAAAKDGEAKKLPTVQMEVYNGGKIRVGYWGVVVVDLAGMSCSDTTPILWGHNSYSPDSIIGQTNKVSADKTLTASGEVMGSGDTVDKVLALAKNGFRFQVSMGADPVSTRKVPEGEVVEANGQTFTGPFTLVMKSTLNEVSLLPLGADKSTSAAIAAEHHNKETTMKDDKGNEIPTAESIRAEAALETKRILAVRQIAAAHPDIMAKAVAEVWDVTKTELAVKDATIAAQKAEIDQMKIQAERPGGAGAPFVLTREEPKLTATLLEATTAIRAGLSKPEKAYGEQTVEAARRVRLHSLTDLVRLVMASEGKQMGHITRHQTGEFLQAAFSTASLSTVLSNVANKFIMQGFGTVENVWRRIAAIRNVVDFKAHTGARLVMADLLKALAPNGEIQHGALSDETRSIQADTKALMLGISRKDIINDDLGVLTEGPQKLGFAAARTLNTDFWAALVAAIASKFPSNNSAANYSNTALGLTGLGTVSEQFDSLVDANGNPIGLQASMLLVSKAQQTLAKELYVATNCVGGTSKSTAANVFAGVYEPVVTRYLSGKGWWLVADPMGAPLMEVAFLNGVQEPMVETAQADFNTLGVLMRCVYDYGVAFAEQKAAVYSAGG